MKFIFLLFLLLSTPALAWQPAFSHLAQAPSFSVQTLEGASKNIADHAGRYVVLEWYSSVCPCINDHYKTGNIQALQKKYKDKLVWLTVTSHDPLAIGGLPRKIARQKLLQEYKSAPSDILLDYDGKLGRAFGVLTTPHIVLISPDNKILYQGAMDQKIEDGDDYSPLKSRNFLTEALEAHLQQKPIAVESHKPYGCSVVYKKTE